MRGGPSSQIRLLQCVEEHGDGKQLVRVRVWPKVRGALLALGGLFALLSLGASGSGAWIAVSVLVLAVFALSLVVARECSAAMGLVLGVLEHSLEESVESPDPGEPVPPTEVEESSDGRRQPAPEAPQAPEAPEVAAAAEPTNPGAAPWTARSETGVAP